MNTKFSLLLATLNRPEILKTCVEILLKQTYENYEIIIVDQSDKEHCDNSIATMDNRITYIHIDQKGLSHARNIGLKYVTGDYICLIDDDGLYEENVLEEANKFIQRYSPIVLGGTIEDPVTGKIKGAGMDCKIKWRDVFKYHQSPSMIVESKFIKEHKFDEDFGIGAKYGSGEESDIVMLSLSCNKEVYFTSKYKVIHTIDASNLEKLPKDRIRNYSFGYGALCKKTFIKYSKFWGLYYLERTVIGNFLLWVINSLKNNKSAAKARKSRAVYAIKGFMNYKSD